ncbi:MAG: hypothetical protein ACE5KF_02310 [Kiloniellaceae bacterium]
MADSAATGLRTEYDPGGLCCETPGKAGRPAGCARPLLDRRCRRDLDDPKARAKDAEVDAADRLTTLRSRYDLSRGGPAAAGGSGQAIGRDRGPSGS